MIIRGIFGGFPPKKNYRPGFGRTWQQSGVSKFATHHVFEPDSPREREAGSSYLRDPERSYLRNRGLPPFADLHIFPMPKRRIIPCETSLVWLYKHGNSMGLYPPSKPYSGSQRSCSIRGGILAEFLAQVRPISTSLSAINIATCASNFQAPTVDDARFALRNDGHPDMQPGSF